MFVNDLPINRAVFKLAMLLYMQINLESVCKTSLPGGKRHFPNPIDAAHQWAICIDSAFP